MLFSVTASTCGLWGDGGNSLKLHARFRRWAHFMGRKTLSLQWILEWLQIPKYKEPESYNPVSVLSLRSPDQWPPQCVCYQGQYVLFPVGGWSRGSAQCTGGEPGRRLCHRQEARPEALLATGRARRGRRADRRDGQLSGCCPGPGE